jgi:hypothetical protein
VPDKKPETEESFIATARKRFEQADTDEKPLREEALIDLKYVAGDQWDPALKQQREAARRPALTFPRCHTFVQQVSNEARQNKPQIKFAPDDDKADQDTAEVYEGLARRIQYDTDAQIAYETSVEYSAGGSFGYFRFLTEENDDGQQDIKILPVLDPFAVYGILVPACFNREPRFGFVVEDMPKEEFEEQHPDSPINTAGFADEWMSKNGWMSEDTVRVAEYWYVEGKGKKAKVTFCKISGKEVLPGTKTEWMGYCIPIIPVLGKGMILQGKPLLFSVVRYQRAAQQMINFAKSRIAETLAVAPISPYMVAKGQIDKGDKKWETLNTNVYPYIEYNQIDNGGKPAPPPQRQTFEPPVQALSGFVAQEIDDMKATTGIFDASLGQKSNETSGTAIQRRQQQSNMTTMHYMDNLERAYKKGGRIFADLIGKVYTEDRMIQILGADLAPKIVRINIQHQDAGGTMRHYKLSGAGKYHPIVTMGREFSTKKMESFDMMSELVQSNKEAMDVMGDILFQNSDMAGADVVAERWKKYIAMKMPGLIEQDDADPKAQAQQAQAQLAQAQQHLQLINAYAQKLEKEKEGKVVEQQGKAQIAQMQEASRLEIVKMQEATKIAVAQINATKDANQAIADAELEQFKILHGSAHEAGIQAVDHAHEHAIADKNAALAAQSQASDQEHDQAMGEQGHDQTLEAQQQAAALQPAAENSNE